MQEPGGWAEFPSDTPRPGGPFRPISGTLAPAMALRKEACAEVHVRFLLGSILGGILTIGTAYLFDNHPAVRATEAWSSAQQPLVNSDVVSRSWDYLTDRARSAWTRLAGR